MKLASGFSQSQTAERGLVVVSRWREPRTQQCLQIAIVKTHVFVMKGKPRRNFRKRATLWWKVQRGKQNFLD